MKTYQQFLNIDVNTELVVEHISERDIQNSKYPQELRKLNGLRDNVYNGEPLQLRNLRCSSVRYIGDSRYLKAFEAPLYFHKENSKWVYEFLLFASQFGGYIVAPIISMSDYQALEEEKINQINACQVITIRVSTAKEKQFAEQYRLYMQERGKNILLLEG